MKTQKMLILATVLLATVFGRIDAMADDNKEYATLAGGCFWCLEAMFEELTGVQKVESGFSGGAAEATYKQVCTGETGHAEVIQVTFEPEQISFRDILTIFFATHDPTTLNRQGADVGTQYRSAVFYHSEDQKAATEEAIAYLEKEKVFDNPVVTEVNAFDAFVIAEDHHQNYYQQNKTQGYCQVVINPKLAKFRKHFADKLK